MPRIVDRAVLAILMAAALPANASKDAKAAGDMAAHTFIETSFLIAPEKVGDFQLEDTSYDEANKHAGAGFRYALKDHQETRFDVFVYPAGRMAETEALTHGMADFRSSFDAAEQAGYYRDVQIVDESEFPLRVPEKPAVTHEAGDTSPSAGAAMDPEKTTILRSLLEADRPDGRRLRMRMVLLPQDVPMRSDGYLFYKQLYFFKVRASAAQDRIDQDSFQALADMAARTLVPAIEVANVGSCANVVVNIDKDAAAKEVGDALMTQVAAHQSENCFMNEAAAGIGGKSRDARVVGIRFDPSDWNGQ